MSLGDGAQTHTGPTLGHDVGEAEVETADSLEIPVSNLTDHDLAAHTALGLGVSGGPAVSATIATTAVSATTSVNAVSASTAAALGSVGFNNLLGLKGIGSGYVLARGTVVTSAAGSADVDTGLTTVVAAAAELIDDPTIASDRAAAKSLASGGYIRVATWGRTSSADCTPASGGVASAYWEAIGT